MHIGLNAHLLSGQAGYRAAGIHRYIGGLLAHLAAAAPAGWRYTAMVGAANTDHFPGIGMRRARLNTENPLARIVWEQAAQPLQLGGFDLLHAMAFAGPLIAPRPMVVTVYDLSFVHYPERLPRSRRWYLSLFARMTARRARRVMAISRATAADLTATWGIAPERIDLVAPGYDAQVFRPLPEDVLRAFRQSKGLPPRFWLFIGTLEPRKNLTTLLEGYAALPPGERLPLVIAGGKGWDTGPIFAAVERWKLGEQVRFPGYLSHEELPFWYNTAEAFVYPSVFEGFGLPVLEAMACGTPVVVSDASSLTEIAEGAGMLVPPYQVQAWTEALRRAGGDVTWRSETRALGLQRAMRYPWQAAAANATASYQRILDGS